MAVSLKAGLSISWHLMAGRLSPPPRATVLTLRGQMPKCGQTSGHKATSLHPTHPLNLDNQDSVILQTWRNSIGSGPVHDALGRSYQWHLLRC